VKRQITEKMDTRFREYDNNCKKQRHNDNDNDTTTTKKTNPVRRNTAIESDCQRRSPTRAFRADSRSLFVAQLTLRRGELRQRPFVLSGITTRQKGETTNYRENGLLLEFILREAAGLE
jgi:hypothetical protein